MDDTSFDVAELDAAVEADREARNRWQRDSRRRRRKALFRAIAKARGQGAPCCELCGYLWRLEVDHLDGRTWQPRSLSSTARVARYFRELDAGVRLRLLCRSCNAGYRPSTASAA